MVHGQELWAPLGKRPGHDWTSCSARRDLNGKGSGRAADNLDAGSVAPGVYLRCLD